MVHSIFARVRGACVFALVLLAPTLLWADTGDPNAHQDRQAWPIELGVSGGSIDDQDGPFCCAGTIGALVEDDTGAQYLLSNNHVMARVNRGVPGEDIVHPGRIDVRCAQIATDVVADLADYVPIDFVGTNLVDAAIALVRPGAVDQTGSILDIGELSPNTVAPRVGMDVKKSGRTTGLTTGTIASIDTTVSVTYGLKCGVGGSGTATFVNQIVVTPGTFSDSGDSGSLVVEDVATTKPSAVGLLFAGSNSHTIANPIDAVLAELGVAMVGGTVPLTGRGSISGTVTDANGGATIQGATVTTDTGVSALTDSGGSYLIPDIPTGTYALTASKVGFSTATQESVDVLKDDITVVDFSLTPETVSAADGSVACITYTTEGGRYADKHLVVAVAVVDGSDAPLGGASVTVAVTFPSGGVDTATAITDASGNAVFQVKNAPDGCYQTAITELNGSGNVSQPLNGFDKGSDLTPNTDCVYNADGCGGTPFSSTEHPRAKGSGRMDIPNAIKVKRQHEQRLMALEGVVGVGVGLSETGEPTLQVYLDAERPATRARIPEAVEGLGTRVIVSGPFEAL